MRKTAFVVHRFYVSLVCFCAVVTGFIAAHAQDQPQPSPNTTFLLHAANSYGISERDTKPWHLRVSFHILDAQGNETDYGTYEEFSQSLFVYKRIYHSEHFSQTQYGVAGEAQITGDHAWPPSFFLLLRNAIVAPMIGLGYVPHFVTDSTVTCENRSIGGVSLRCFDIARKLPQGVPNTLTYCFDGSVLTRYTVGPLPMGEAIFKNPVNYEGRLLPGDVVIERADAAPQVYGTLTAHIDSIEILANIDDAFFQPPADAKPLQSDFGIFGVSGVAATPRQGDLSVPKSVNISAGVAAGMLLEHTPPAYPPIARAARVSGAVVLQATIGKDGAVENLRVISGPAMLQQAALDAVKTWRYRPYLLNGQPIEVLTTVNVIFALPLPHANQQQ